MARARRLPGRLTSKHPFVRRVERALAAGSRGPRIVAGVSGGADSVFLLRALHALSAVQGFEVEAAHFNHRWRGGESDADATFVENLAHALGVPFQVGIASPGRRRTESPEEAARSDRYRFLARVAHERGADVAVGHTLDDQLETYLIGWLRGSGPAGASLMPSVGRVPVSRSGARLLRPLLMLERDEIRSALQAAGIEWREDRSNQDPRFLRNRVRRELVPLLESLAPGARKTVLRAAQLSQDAVDFLQRRAESETDRLFRRAEGGLAAERRAFLELDPALRAQVLIGAVRRLAGSAQDVESTHLESGIKLIVRGAGGKRTPIGPRAELRLAGGRVVLTARAQPE